MARSYCLDTFVPDVRTRVGKTNPCINRSIIHLKRLLKRLERKKNSLSGRHLGLQNELGTRVQLARSHCFSTTLPNSITNSPENFWRHLGSKEKSIDNIFVNRISTWDLGKKT